MNAVGLVAAALLATATPDPTFDGDGKVLTDFRLGDSAAHAVAVQPDGEIVAVGRAGGDFALVRYDTDGSVDFATTTDFGGNDWANFVAVQGNGRIVAGGVADAAFALARYNADGSLDRTFGDAGTFIFHLGRAARIERVFSLADGRILAVGTGDGRLALAWFRENGSHERTVLTTLRPEPIGAARAPGGKIVVAAPRVVNPAAPNPRVDFVVARFHADGRRDRTFGGDGVVVWRAPRHWTGGHALAVDASGRVVIAAHGHRDANARAGFGLARFRRDGSLDRTFGDGGIAVAEVGFGPHAVAIDRKGRIVVVGASYSLDDFTIARFTSRGRLDASFGAVTTDFGAYETPWAVAIQPDGRAVSAGQTGRTLGEPTGFALARYRG